MKNKIENRTAYCVVCPTDEPKLLLWTLNKRASSARRILFNKNAASRRKDKTWSDYYKEGYRCVKVNVEAINE